MDSPLAEFGIDSRARLVLYANRLAHEGSDAMETVPLGQLASVRVAFERDPRKFNWAVGLLVVALVLALVAAPLHNSLVAAAAKLGDPARRESLDALLLTVFNSLGGFASLLPALAAALAVLAAALLVYFWLGSTVLTLAFAATERSFEVRGRNSSLFDFAHSVAEQLAARKA
jgi:hypothetical protein